MTRNAPRHFAITGDITWYGTIHLRVPESFYNPTELFPAFSCEMRDEVFDQQGDVFSGFRPLSAERPLPRKNRLRRVIFFNLKNNMLRKRTRRDRSLLGRDWLAADR